MLCISAQYHHDACASSHATPCMWIRCRCSGLYVLVVLEIKTRAVPILGVTARPAGERAALRGRNLLIDLGEHARPFRFLSVTGQQVLGRMTPVTAREFIHGAVHGHATPYVPVSPADSRRG